MGHGGVVDNPSAPWVIPFLWVMVKGMAPGFLGSFNTTGGGSSGGGSSGIANVANVAIIAMSVMRIKVLLIAIIVK